MRQSYSPIIRIFLLFAFGLFLHPQMLLSQCATVSPAFTLAQTNTCGIPRNITLNNTSTGVDTASAKYYWKINNALFDSSIGKANKLFKIKTPGVYTFMLLVIGPGGCRDSVTQTITVTTSSPRVYDSNFSLSWNPVWQNCITGLGSNVTYTISIGSADTIKNYTIVWGDTAANTTGTVLNPGSFINKTYSALGFYTLMLITQNGSCTDTVFGSVQNERIPSAGVTGPTAGLNSGCTPFRVRFINSSYNTSGSTYFIWDWGDGETDSLGPETYNDTIYHTYKKGAYTGSCAKTVKVTAKNNCGQSQATWSSVNLYDKDDANITSADSVKCIATQGKTFTFNNSSALNCMPGVRWYYWDFGDGSNSGWMTQKISQTHTYPTSGFYTVMLIDSNLCGSDTAFYRVALAYPPNAGFTFTTPVGCAPVTVFFNDTSNGVLNQRVWDFADTSMGQSRWDTAKMVSHTFHRAGSYQVKLLLANPCDTGTRTVTVNVYSKPDIQIGNLSSGCAPFTIQFNNNTTNYSPYAQAFWDFGNGTYSNAWAPPVITYTTPGLYNMMVRIVDTCGTDSFTYPINVFRSVKSKFKIDTLCLGSSVIITDSSYVVGGVDSIVAYKYYWGNNTVTSSIYPNPSYTYPLAGTYRVVQEVFSNNGCIDTSSIWVHVKESPTTSFSYTPTPNICDRQVITFTGAATTPVGTIVSYSYNFGDGTTATSKDTSHRYALPGSYAVRFGATNSEGCTRYYYDTVIVRQNPVAKIKVDTNCYGQATIFTDSSYVGGGDIISARAWDFTGDGNWDAFSQFAAYSYPAAGTYTAILRVTSNRGCLDYDTLQVVIKPLPTPSISVDANSKCMFENFVFTNTTANGNTYRWIWGDTTQNTITNTTATVSHAYAAPGNYIVKMIATSSFGCVDSTSINLTVKPTPRSRFTVNDTISCAPHTFTFSNTSTLADGYQWYVNGILSGTSANRPDTTIFTDGVSLQIMLVATNTNLCKPDTFIRTIETRPDPIANYTVSRLDSCGPFTLFFNNLSSGATTYYWDFGDGGFSNAPMPNHTFFNTTNRDTVYQVRLIALSGVGCDDTLIRSIRVYPKPTINFNLSNQDSCGPLTVRINNYSHPGDTGSINDMSFFWDFGNGTSGTCRDTSIKYLAHPTNDTTYRIKLWAYNEHGCVDTLSKTVTVHPNANADFNLSRADSCGPFTVKFTNTSAGGNGLGLASMQFFWDFGNGVSGTMVDTSIRYVASLTADTTYVVRLVAISNFGCPDTLTKTVTVHPKPKAGFIQSDTALCSPALVTFTNTSFPYDFGNISNMNFHWDFGNGITSNKQDTSILFKAAQFNDTVYTITLIAYSFYGCADTITSTVRVYPSPINGFTENGLVACRPFNTTFTNNSLNASTYFWDFGDGTTSTLQHPNHTYQGRPLMDTTYQIKMVGMSDKGCPGDTVYKTMLIRQYPIADFQASPDSGCGPLHVQFLNNSLGAVSYLWDFGDGTFSNIINPAHTYVNNTTYSVKLIATNIYGCTDTASGTVYVSPFPGVSFSHVISDGCAPLQVDFVNGSNGTVRQLWDFGDGTTDTLFNVSHVYTNSTPVTQSYTVKLTGWNLAGCSQTVSSKVDVYPLPKPDFNYVRPYSCTKATVDFYDLSINAAKYLWQFGDGDTSTLPNPSHDYKTSNFFDTTYNVKLIITSAMGCIDSVVKPVIVKPIVKSNFRAAPIKRCVPVTVTFTDSSIYAASLFWDFGDGTYTTLQNPQHTYSQPGLYTVKLIAIGYNGCRDTLVRTNYIEAVEVPLAGFTANPIKQSLPTSTVTFTDETVSSLPITYAWDFGDGNSSSQQNPKHTFVDSGTYNVKLRVDNGFCVDEIVRPVRIDPLAPTAIFEVSTDSGCAELPVQFTNKSTFGNSYKWQFGDGSVSFDKDPMHIYRSPGVYSVMLTAYGLSGIDDTVMLNLIHVFPRPVADFKAVPLTAYLPSGVINFINLSRGADFYEWLFTNTRDFSTVSSTDENPGMVFTSDGVYDARLISKNSAGCSDTLLLKQYVTVIGGGSIFVPNAFTPNFDNVNDVFRPVTTGVLPNDYELKIFNRWGQLIFESHDPTIGWDGSYNGQACQTEAYLWMIKGRYIDDKEFNEHGSVLLMR